MDEEFKSLLRRNLEITRENNKLLRKMHRSAVVSRIVQLIWWSILIGVPIFVYYYILQPYLRELLELYSGVQNGVSDVQELLGRIPFIGDFLQDFNTGTSTDQVAKELSR